LHLIGCTLRIYIYIHSSFVGLDNKLYKMHGTYIKIVYVPLLTLYCSCIIVVNRDVTTAYWGVVFFTLSRKILGSLLAVHCHFLCDPVQFINHCYCTI